MHHRNVMSAMFIPNGKRILTISNDCVGVLWDSPAAPRALRRVEWYELLLGTRVNSSVDTSDERDPEFTKLTDQDVDNRWKTLRQDQAWVKSIREYQTYLTTLPKAKVTDFVDPE
jgi:hypothetical protein